jgi:hypothetical protein
MAESTSTNNAPVAPATLTFETDEDTCSTRWIYRPMIPTAIRSATNSTRIISR